MGVLFFFYDGVDGCGNGQFYAVFSRQVEECLRRADAFGQFFEGLSFDEVLAEMADFKMDLIESWLGDQPLSGGAGRAIQRVRAITLASRHAL